MPRTTASVRPADRFDRVWQRLAEVPWVAEWRVLREGIFLLSGLPIALAVLIVTVGGSIAGSVLTLLAGIGLVILAWTLATILWIARWERARVRVLLRVPIGEPHRWSDETGPVTRRAWNYVRNPQIWRDVVYMILLFPTAVFEFFLVILPVQLIISPFVVRLGGSITSNLFWSWEINSTPESIVAFALGMIAVVPISMLMNLASTLHGQAALVLLGTAREEEMIRRVETLTESRSAVVRAMAMERDRLERNIHDGIEVQLLGLADELARLDMEMERGEAAAGPELVQAHERSKQVLHDVRELVRAIHPVVLTDRGLDAAISAIAGRSAVPVSVDVSFRDRLPEELEGIAYYVVVEALENVEKYSQAQSASVEMSRSDRRLVIDVRDDGVGGANEGRAGGLRGMQDRINAVDGVYRLESPHGRGTHLHVEIPTDDADVVA